MLIVMFAVLIAALMGAVAGARAMAWHLTVRAPTARERANHRDAIALARDLIKTPDALDLRDRAAALIAAYEALPTNRKDT